MTQEKTGSDSGFANTSNGRAPLSKAALADRSKFKFKKERVDLPEIGGYIVVKVLSVAERDGLPDMVDKDGNPDVDVDKLAQIFSVVVAEPEGLTADEAREFLGEWPGPALDRVIEKFGELVGGEEERKAAASSFPKQ